MNKLELLKKIADDNEGILTTNMLTKKGIDNKYIQRAVEKNILEKYCNSVYISKELFYDPLFVINKALDQSVYNLETALILHGYNNQIDYIKTIASNKTTTKFNNTSITIEKNLKLGKIKMKTAEGNSIYVFDIERTICDLIKYRKKIDIEIYSNAINKYFTSNDRDIEKILKYAKELNIYDTVKIIVEVFYATKCQG